MIDYQTSVCKCSFPQLFQKLKLNSTFSGDAERTVVLKKVNDSEPQSLLVQQCFALFLILFF